MREIEGVSDFVHRFFNQAICQNPRIMGQPVKLLREPVERNYCTWAAHLRLAEHERLNGNVEVDGGDAEYPPRAIGGVPLHGLEQFRGMVLPALRMKGKSRVEAPLQNAARDAEGIRERGRYSPEQPRVEVSDRQQVEHLHCVSRGRLQPYFFSL